jgi:hypothetical protein
MTARRVSTTPEAKFAQQVTELIEARIRKLRFVIPIFTADPPETDPTNLWMRWDGRLRSRYWNGTVYVYTDYPLRSDITSPPAVPAYPANPSPPSLPQTVSRTWVAQWSQTYKADRTQRTDTAGNVLCFFGSEAAYNKQLSLLGFDYADIASKLSGSTIQSITVTMAGINSYYPTGAQVAMGMHNQATKPSVYNETTTILRYGNQETILPGTNIAYSLPMAFAQQLRAGTAKGLVLEAPGPDKGFWGSVAGVGSTYPAPQLTITYAK